MNCEKAERCILLLGSGELPPPKRARLERHVSACPRCRAYREDVDRILAAAERGLPSGQPGPGTLSAIRGAARAGVQEGRKASSFAGSLVFVGWRPALAVAAAALICVAGWYMLAGRSSPSPAMRISEAVPLDVEDRMSFSTPDILYELTVITVEDDMVFERVSDLAGRPDISLADRDLIILEGLAI